MAIAGQQPDADRVPARHQSITIMLDLVHPAWPSWRLLTRRWQAGLDNGRQAISSRCHNGPPDHGPEGVAGLPSRQFPLKAQPGQAHARNRVFGRQEQLFGRQDQMFG